MQKGAAFFRGTLLLFTVYLFLVRYNHIAAGGGRRLGQLDQPGLGIEIGGEGGGQGGQVHGLRVRIDAVKESQDRRGQAAVFRGRFFR